MSQEIAIPGFYQSTYDQNFLSTNMGAKVAMEYFLSTLLFKGDLNRVLYSKEDIAFRRRVETVGYGSVKSEKFNYAQLNLPFAIYSQTGSFEEDDRGSTQNAGQIILGRMNPETGFIIRAAAVKMDYEAIIFFGRRDDINIASQLLFWEKTPKYPFLFTVDHEICGHPISIPFFVSLESFDSNINYGEKDWLEKSKIFPIKCKFTIRSYQTLIENIDQYFNLPIRFSGLYGCNHDCEVVYTQKTTLIWADQKWSEDSTSIDEENTIENDFKHLPVYIKAREKVEDHMKEYGRGHIEEETNSTVRSAVEGYLSEDRDCTLDEFFQNMENTTETEISIDWRVREDMLPYFKEIIIYIPGICNVSVSDHTQTSITIPGLYPGSKYNVTLIVISKSDCKLTYKLDTKTKGEPVLGKTLASNLVGKTFTDS